MLLLMISLEAVHAEPISWQRQRGFYRVYQFAVSTVGRGSLRLRDIGKNLIFWPESLFGIILDFQNSLILKRGP